MSLVLGTGSISAGLSALGYTEVGEALAAGALIYEGADSVYHYFKDSKGQRFRTKTVKPLKKRMVTFGNKQYSLTTTRPRRKKRKRSRSVSGTMFTAKPTQLSWKSKYRDYEYKGTLGGNLSGAEHDPSTILSVSGVEVGTGQDQRLGNFYRVYGLHMKGFLSKAELTGAASQEPRRTEVRLMVILDTQTNGTQMSSEDLFISNTNSELNVMSLIDSQKLIRYKILYDKLINMPARKFTSNVAASPEAPGQRIPFEVQLKKLNIRINANVASGNIGDQVDNSIHVIALYDVAVSIPVLYYKARCFFKDI